MMLVKGFLIALLLLPVPGFFGVAAASDLPGPYLVLSYQVLDGDSIRVVLPVWFDQTVQVNLRLRGIDAPETRRGTKGGQAIAPCEIEDGKKAKAYLESILKGKPLSVSNISRDSYVGRAVGDITLPGVIDVAALMIAAGHAAPYQYKNGRKPWACSPGVTGSPEAARPSRLNRSA